MRCPRCDFDGDPIDGACSYCGYRRINVSGKLLSARVLTTQPLSGESRAQTMPLYSLPRGRTQPLSLSNASIGDTLKHGRYQLMKRLALPENQQGQGSAWLAIDMQADRTQVVVRDVLAREDGRRDTKKLLLAVTSRLAESGSQGGIPRILDSFDEQGRQFLVLQYIEGESLASLVHRQGGALPERTVAEYSRQLCEILAILADQDHPIVHGAINPKTIIVTSDRRHVYLINLPLFPPKETPESSAVSAYKAPEQVRGALDNLSDLYSVAATMHYAVTGSDPHQHAAFLYPLARQLNPAISPLMESILEHELRLLPSQRYASVAEMQKDLALLLSNNVPIQKEGIRGTIGSSNLDVMQMRLHAHRRSIRDLSLVGSATLLVLLGLLLFWNLSPLFKSTPVVTRPTPNATATLTAAYQKDLSQELQTYQQEHVGLSDGLFVFDTFPGRSSVALQRKVQAAQALQSGHEESARELYISAVAADPTDGEAQIYNQDRQIKLAGVPYITIVLGISLDNNATNLSQSRAILQSAYEYQHLINIGQLLPGNMKLRLLIANTGNVANDDTEVGVIAQYVANRVRAGNPDNIVAVVGWPTTGASQNALSALAAVHIPLVSQSAPGTELTGLSPYFFRLNPANDVQGEELGMFAVQYLQAKRIVVVQDRDDPYSRELASAFSSSVQARGGQILSADMPLANSHGGATEADVAQFQNGPLEEAIQSRADLIFLAGYDRDAVRMAHAIGNGFRTYPWSSYLSHLNVLGGDALNTDLVRGIGTGQDAFIARQYATDMQHLSFASFGDVSEWEGRSTPLFFSDWARVYHGVKNLPSITTEAIMTNDTFGVIDAAIKLIQGSLTGEKIRAALASIGQGNVPAYMGLSGRISFSSNGDPVNKAIVILQLVPGPSVKVNRTRLVSYAGQF